MDGFVITANGYASGKGYFDQRGVRSIGYYNFGDLPYYYFMATQFATSDRFFSPNPSSSPTNRLFALAATSIGRVFPPTTTFSNKTIFQLLEEHGISWKIYYTDVGGDGIPLSRIFSFQPFANDHRSKIVPISEYKLDLDRGTLPQVALIESGYGSGRDEHPGGTVNGQPNTGNHIQVGAQYASDLINKLMTSSSWHDSVFIFSFDEGGGTYDHVVPMLNVPRPDGLSPVDLISTSVPGDFTRYGFRLPMIVISPFSKKHFVSHTPTDYTAILKLTETRFGLPSLTNRDAAQMDMTEFFDFANPPWVTPPTPPLQNVTIPCNYTNIPE
jgi:phospholipase C